MVSSEPGCYDAVHDNRRRSVAEECCRFDRCLMKINALFSFSCVWTVESARMINAVSGAAFRTLSVVIRAGS